MTLKSEFENYLIDKGYKVTTDKGNPSTVYDYIKRIERVIRDENLDSWENIREKINDIVKKYDEGGEKEDCGKKSHRAVINALKRFQEFIASKEADK